jgi:AcrR family transcriptional regulator
MPRPRTDIRPRILLAARDRFAATGVDASSLRGIASDAGTSIGMVYYYFPTKDDLFLGVVEDVYVRLLADLEAALGGADTFGAQVEGLYRRIAQLSSVEVQVVRLVLREALSSQARFQSLLERFSRGHIPLVVKAVAQGIRAGQLRTDLHPLALLGATLSLGTVPQMAVRALGDRLPFTPPTPEEFTRQLISALLGGIGAPSRAAK